MGLRLRIVHCVLCTAYCAFTASACRCGSAIALHRGTRNGASDLIRIRSVTTAATFFRRQIPTEFPPHISVRCRQPTRTPPVPVRVRVCSCSPVVLLLLLLLCCAVCCAAVVVPLCSLHTPPVLSCAAAVTTPPLQHTENHKTKTAITSHRITSSHRVIGPANPCADCSLHSAPYRAHRRTVRAVDRRQNATEPECRTAD